MKQKLLAVLVALVMTVSLSVTAFAAPEDETVEAATTTTRVTTSKDTSDEAIARATAEGGEDEEEDETRTVDEIITSYNNNNGRVLSAAKAGYPRLYPEDSLTGLRYCVENGVDIISVTVQQTKDKGLVLLEDATIDRMLVDRSTGEAGKGKVSSYTLEELQNNFYLRDGHGGSKKATKETVPGLHDALELTRNSVMLYITNGFQYAETINDVAKGLNACDVVILGGATSADDIKIFVDHTGTPICHITSNFVDGTTEGAPRNFIKDTLDAGADAVNLATDKDYSAIFKSSTTKRFEDAGRGMVSATTFATSGEHVDRIEGWQELIEAGYSIIETDYPKELSVYIKDIESYRTELSSLITQAQTLNTDKFSKETAKTLKKTLADAETMSSKGAVSLRQMDETRYNLQESIDALELGEEVDQVHTPIWQILLIIAIVLLAIAGIVLVALRVFNKHKKEFRKQRKVRRKYKAMSEKNLAEAETVIDETTPTISQDTAGLNIYESFTGETLERPVPEEPVVPVEPEVNAESIKDDFQKMLKDLEDARRD
ncbi:MAG: glycerophosphodiester phosphodiesterase family protein [Acutalibacteraceae bacterium]|nr:glycerophosphodiester phosphodiesterase family protein [Clostridia bacterium]MEE1188170.1 glycerophosphodiester phosphodiesterase family protein [Acutalibacteraceae bacterium]